MARSGKEQVAANRRRIVAAASELFRSRGYDAVGIADVMKAAGMTQGGFYKHFATKEALAREAWGMGFISVKAAWESVGREEADGPEKAVTAIVDYYLSVQPPEDRCPMQAHGEDSARASKDGVLRAIYSHGAAALYETFVTKAQETMDVDGARLLFAAMVGATMLGRASGDASWAEEIKDSVRKAAK